MKKIKKLLRKLLHVSGIKKRKINMLDAYKLKELKDLANQLKNDIMVHHNNDPLNKDDFDNAQLYGLLDSTINKIDKISTNNNVDLNKL